MTTKIKAKRITIDRQEPIYTQFDAVDTKGRRFGARVRIEVIEWDHADADVRCPYLIPEDHLGRWYVVHPYATRGGELFGASHGGSPFREESEALAYIAKYFADAEKRALKNKARAA